MKKFSFWLWATVIFQFITGVIHSIGLFINPAPQNDTEKQIANLLDSYHMPLGMGFDPTYANLIWALSSCFTMLYLLGGCLNLYLYKKKIPIDTMKGVMRINTILFGISFGIMLAFTFLLPIICTGLVLISCLGAYFTASSKA